MYLLYNMGNIANILRGHIFPFSQSKMTPWEEEIPPKQVAFFPTSLKYYLVS